MTAASRLALAALAPFATSGMMFASGGAALACEKVFPSEQAQAAYYAARAVQADDVILGQVVDVVAVPAPGEVQVIQGDATLVVLKVRKGSKSAGDRIVVPVRKQVGSRACDWEVPAVGATYEVYLAFDSVRGEYRVLDSASVKPEPRP